MLMDYTQNTLAVDKEWCMGGTVQYKKTCIGKEEMQNLKSLVIKKIIINICEYQQFKTILNKMPACLAKKINI